MRAHTMPTGTQIIRQSIRWSEVRPNALTRALTYSAARMKPMQMIAPYQ